MHVIHWFNSGTVPLHPDGRIKKMFGGTSFSLGAPTLWNALPTSECLISLLLFNLVYVHV